MCPLWRETWQALSSKAARLPLTQESHFWDLTLYVFSQRYKVRLHKISLCNFICQETRETRQLRPQTWRNSSKGHYSCQSSSVAGRLANVLHFLSFVTAVRMSESVLVLRRHTELLAGKGASCLLPCCRRGGAGAGQRGSWRGVLQHVWNLFWVDGNVSKLIMIIHNSECTKNIKLYFKWLKCGM